ncbi:Trehalose-6-phosphate phosphatase [Planoprotostelium fungivorum]|uniref:Trehalose-6-phosphate phosphatase n=1 Tax=Planoprotostelium fungivorum TaxID=1890364 RepID=A0A2P6N8M0_9EUKA|nr:Trehalose-6-phosphate phosphatase [Planoprotostelium fungivorum]
MKSSVDVVPGLDDNINPPQQMEDAYNHSGRKSEEKAGLLQRQTLSGGPGIVLKPQEGFFSALSSERAWENFWRAVVGEFIGTFLLMYVGMSAIYAQTELLYVVMTWTTIIPILITVFGKISGAFFNPSVTLVFCVLGDVKPIKAFFCVIAQLLGACAACSVLLYMWPMVDRVPYYQGCTTITGGVYRGFINEVAITFIQIFLILSLTRSQGAGEPQFPHNIIAPFGIAAIIFSCIMIGAGPSGASMNPARSFAPALVAGYWKDQWVYWVGPTMGALLGLILWHLFVKPPDKEVPQPAASIKMRRNSFLDAGSEPMKELTSFFSTFCEVQSFFESELSCRILGSRACQDYIPEIPPKAEISIKNTSTIQAHRTTHKTTPTEDPEDKKEARSGAKTTPEKTEEVKAPSSKANTGKEKVPNGEIRAKDANSAQIAAAIAKPTVLRNSCSTDAESLKTLDEQVKKNLEEPTDGSYVEKLRYEACVFDLDGVITESATVHRAAWKKLFDAFLKEKGDKKEFSDEDYRKYVDGLPRYDGVEKFLESRKLTLPRGKKTDGPGFDTVCSLGNMKDGYFNETLQKDGVKAYPGSVALLQDLKEKGVKTAVASSSRSCQKVLQVAGIEHLFDVRVDGTTVDALGLKGKPAPDIFLKACEVLGAHPDLSIVFEDALGGVHAGYKGNFGLVVGIDRGGNREGLLENGAELVVDDLDKLNIWLLNDSFPMRETDWTLHLDYNTEPKQKRLSQTLSTLGNGYFATLGAPEESMPKEEKERYAGTYLAGGYNRVTTQIKDKKIETEEFVNLPDWTRLTWKLKDSNEWFTQQGKYKIEREDVRLNIKLGVLVRKAKIRTPEGERMTINSQRLVHMGKPHVAVIKYSISSESYEGPITLRSSLIGSVRNRGASRYAEITDKHWNIVEKGTFQTGGTQSIYLTAQTNGTRLLVSWAARTRLYLGTNQIEPKSIQVVEDEEDIHQDITFDIAQGQSIVATLFTTRDRGILDPQEAAQTEMISQEKERTRYYTLLSTQEMMRESYWKNFELSIQMDGQETHDTVEEEEEKSQQLRRVGKERLYGVRHSHMVNRYNEDELSQDLQFILRFNLFHLSQNCNTNISGGDASIPARGLTGESYRGHIFWDEIFVTKALLGKSADIAKTLLWYRYYRLPAARVIAREMGRNGACYPWQSGSSGREETSRIHFNYVSNEWYPDLSWHQRHVNIAIFYNFYQYAMHTDDSIFTLLYGSEVMIEIARFWSSMCEFNEKTGRYDIKHVMGPDEFHEKYPNAPVEEAGVTNNAYTNIMVSWLMDKTLELLEQLPVLRTKELRKQFNISDDELKKWKHITQRLTVVFHEDLIISQFEGYDQLKELDWEEYRQKYKNIGRIDLILKAEKDSSDNYKLAKQADTVMLFYLLSHEERMGYAYSIDLIYKTIRYYFDRCTHGSTLSLVVYSYVLYPFNPEEAWHMYKQFVASDVVDVQGGSSAEGIHVVPMAASYNMLYYQILGIEPKDSVLTINPRLPKEMIRIKTQYIYGGKMAQFDVDHNQLKVTVKGSANRKPMTIQYGKHKYEIEEGSSAQFHIDRHVQEAKSMKCAHREDKLRIPEKQQEQHEKVSTK